MIHLGVERAGPLDRSVNSQAESATHESSGYSRRHTHSLTPTLTAYHSLTHSGDTAKTGLGSYYLT